MVPTNSFDHNTHFDSGMVDNAVSLIERIKIEQITNIHNGGFRTFEYDYNKPEDRRRIFNFYRAAKNSTNNVVQSFFDQPAFSSDTDLPQKELTYREYYGANNNTKPFVIDITPDQGFTENVSKNPPVNLHLREI